MRDLSLPRGSGSCGGSAPTIRSRPPCASFLPLSSSTFLPSPPPRRRADRRAVIATASKISPRLSVLHDSAAAVGALDVGFVPTGPAAGKGPADSKPEVVLLLGADDYSKEDVPPGAKVIYVGSHGERGASRADVVLPGGAYTEKYATWVNTEGRPQRSQAAVALPGNARADWEVLRALSEVAGVQLPYDSLAEVRQRMFDVAPHLVRPDVREEPSDMAAEALAVAAPGKSAKEPFRCVARALEIYALTAHFLLPPARSLVARRRRGTLAYLWGSALPCASFRKPFLE